MDTENPEIDNIAANEGKIVGLKDTYPDDEERAKIIYDLKDQYIEVFADTSNQYDRLAMRCFYEGNHLGYIASESCVQLYPYLDEMGHARAQVVRIGKHSCLIVRFLGVRRMKPELNVKFPLQDDDLDVPFSEAETYLAYSYRNYLEQRELYVAMNLFPNDYTEKEWDDLLGNLNISVTTYLKYFTLTPSIEDREQLHDVMSICDSVLQNLSHKSHLASKLDAIRNVRNQLYAIHHNYMGESHYNEIVAAHYDVFRLQCITFRYANRYLNRLTSLYGDKPTVNDLMAEHKENLKALLSLDPKRSDLRDFSDIKHLGVFVFYQRLNRQDLYIFYKHIFRISLLQQWMRQATCNEELKVDYVLNGSINLTGGVMTVENMQMQGDVIECGGSKTTNN